MNQIKATISPGYRWRLVLISIVLLGFGAYCVYDWQIGYPLKVEQFDKWTQLETDYPETYPEKWESYALEQGWDTRPPAKKTDRDVFTQLLMACIVLPIGVYFLVKLIRENARWVAMSDDGFTANGGKSFGWDDVTGLDETKWKSKGIAYVQYRGASNGNQRLLLDDFKMQREPVKAMVQRLQQHLNPAEPEPVESMPPEASSDDAEPTSPPTA